MSTALLSHDSEARVQSPVVETAVRALCAFAGDDLTRSDAAALLAISQFKRLDEKDFDAVLDAFGPERDLVAGSDYLPLAEAVA